MNEQETEALRMDIEIREKRLRECALRIQEHIGYVIDRIDRGEPVSAGHYLNGISSDAQEARILIGALEGMQAAMSAGTVRAPVREKGRYQT